MITIFASAPIALAISTICCSGMLSVSTSRSRIDRRADPAEQLRRAAVARRQSTRRHAAAALERQRDVLGDGEVREERRLLIDRGDAERCARSPDPCGGTWAPPTRSVPGVRLFGAGDDLDERGLPGAVLADERVHFARRADRTTRPSAPARPRRTCSIDVACSRIARRHGHVERASYQLNRRLASAWSRGSGPGRRGRIGRRRPDAQTGRYMVYTVGHHFAEHNNGNDPTVDSSAA